MARITMKLATAACTAALGAAAFADAAREWTGATSADLSVAANWSELAGGTDNVSYFKKGAMGLKLAGGKTLTIRAKGLSDAAKYVKRVTLNGREVAGGVLRHADLVRGGELVFEMCE
jgi:urocanate hydratase